MRNLPKRFRVKFETANGELMEKARQMAEDVGRRAATVAEARGLLGVPKREEATA